MNAKLILALLAVGTILNFATSQDKPKESSTYEALVEKVKSSDKSVDFTQLRLAYADSPTSRPDTDPQKKAMTAALNSKNYAEVLKNADVVLASDFVDMDAQFAEYVAQRELNHPEQAEFHRFVLKGLLDSVAHSGDGKSEKTAFQVIEVHEEYVILHFMGLTPSKQSLSKKDGHSYDVMEVVNSKTREKVTLYFNIDIPMKSLSDALK
jgi:Tfp pilus assembly protein FimV